MNEPIKTADMVEAIRADTIVGRGSCSPVDECFTDDELVEFLRLGRKRTIKGAVAAAREYHDLWAEVGDDIRNA